MAKSMLSLFKKETEEEKGERIKKEEEKEVKENPLIQGKSLDPKNGIKHHSIIVESMGTGLEKHYFWVLRFLKDQPNHGLGFEVVEKIRDLFDASVTSSFHGHVGTKLSAMQQQAQQYLGLIGQMVKTIFPIVRELRVMDERLEHYDNSLAGDESAEIALKSIWIELVEQGMQNPNSVYSLATKVGFVTLPDLFFKINVKKKEDIDSTVKSLRKEGMNRKVCDVLAKKLYQYYVWKEKTYTEMQHTRKFKLKYLRQHYTSIKMYMNWVRPYLQTIQSLQMKNSINDADLVAAFETSKIQVELMAIKKKSYKKYASVLLVKFIHTTRPELQYTPQGQKQPIHVGRTEMIIEPYVATKAQIDAYKDHKDSEDMELLATMDETMGAIQEDLQRYLKEAGEEFDEDKMKEGEAKKPELIGPFKALYQGFGDMFPFFDKKGPRKKPKAEAKAEAKEKTDATGTAKTMAYVLYDIFKKANKFYSPVV